MNLQKTFFAAAALLGGTYLAAGMHFWTSGQVDSPMFGGDRDSKMLELAQTQPIVEKLVFPGEDVAVTAESAALDTRDDPRPTDSGKLPGIFRGDWGEAPVYARNDRVNHDGAAYLSLDNGNQNQPPSLSPDYWRLLKTFKKADQQACQSPGQGADLSKCDFSDAVSLNGRNLSGAVMIKARLSGELGSADLSGANLSGSAVIGSLVIGPETRLQGANLSKLQSDGNNPLIAESADLHSANLTEANLYGARMTGANLAGALLTGATMTGAELVSSRLEGAELSKANLSYANLTEAHLANAALPEADLSEANLANSDFVKANLQQANLAGADLSGSDFSGADLRGANLAAIKGADDVIVDGQTDFTYAICPDGVTVDGTQVTTCVGHGF